MLEKFKRLIKQNKSVYLRLKLIQKGKFYKPNFKKKIKGRGNQFNIHLYSEMHNCIIDIIGDNNTINIHKNVLLNNVFFFIRGNNNNITISRSVRFNRKGEIWVEDYNCEVFIDEKTSFEDVHIAVTEPNSTVRIGKNCLFANNIDIRTGDSHSIIDKISNKRINFAKNVTIRNNVWIAAHVSILKGVTILDNTIVATRSVVTKSFNSENIILGGSPAKIIKKNVYWKSERIYDAENKVKKI